MNIEELQSPSFKNALRDYYYLINKNYPERGILKLVGDRYKLSGDLRTILYRGISSQKKAIKRQCRLTNNTGNQLLLIDGYNTLFTILNYRLGRFVFISNDTICRDAGSLHGKLRNQVLLEECVELLLDFLKSLSFEKAIIYLDAPVSKSSFHKKLFEKRIQSLQLCCECRIDKSADLSIKENIRGVLITSDTGIIDQTNFPVFDLSRKLITETFNANLFELSWLL
ncbi:MAG: DUF434 domain-containing protein [Bacteroidales bacterium]|nr:DUF434 domain-containing protein [Bacteroidales bacterium]